MKNVWLAKGSWRLSGNVYCGLCRCGAPVSMVCISQSVNQLYTALSPMLEVAGNIILKVTKEQFLVENSSSCYAILGSSLLNCSIYFQIIGPSFPLVFPLDVYQAHSPQTPYLPSCHLTFLPFSSTTLSFSSPLSILLTPAPISI